MVLTGNDKEVEQLHSQLRTAIILLSGIRLLPSEQLSSELRYKLQSEPPAPLPHIDKIIQELIAALTSISEKLPSKVRELRTIYETIKNTSRTDTVSIQAAAPLMRTFVDNTETLCDFLAPDANILNTFEVRIAKQYHTIKQLLTRITRLPDTYAHIIIDAMQLLQRIQNFDTFLIESLAEAGIERDYNTLLKHILELDLVTIYEQLEICRNAVGTSKQDMFNGFIITAENILKLFENYSRTEIPAIPLVINTTTLFGKFIYAVLRDAVQLEEALRTVTETDVQSRSPSEPMD